MSFYIVSNIMKAIARAEPSAGGNMKSLEYLKDYVQQHPGNKMAWYLLGKEYDKNGQEGKANYCYNRAGGVYEAFERSKVPADLLADYEEGVLRDARRREQRKRIRRHLMLIMLLLFFPLAIPAAAPGLFVHQDQVTDAAAPPAADADNPQAVQDRPAAAGASPEAALLFTAGEADAEPGGGMWKAMRTLEAGGPAAVSLGMERADEWLLWKEQLPLDYMLHTTAGGKSVHQSFNREACSCSPPEEAETVQTAAEWQSQQVERAVLWSAIRHFQNAKGRLPESLDELAGPFPGNWLAGTSPGMEAAFAPLAAAAAGWKPGPGTLPGRLSMQDDGPGARPFRPGAAGYNASGAPFMEEPLTIVVDKENHRLALVSGNIMIRNYEVGLGGELTPAGRFAVTDKVVNPNGSADGAFGSRGLQLSEGTYAIHGTDEPETVGGDESLGCVRMARGDLEELFLLAPMGTPVIIDAGVLPDELLVPRERISLEMKQDQTNPRKMYRWLF